MTVSLAIVGAGSIGKRHAEAIQAAGAQVRWVVDADSMRASELAEKCQARATAKLGDALADPDTVAMVIGVPNFLHKPLAIESLRAGKDVLLEKPMGMNSSECDEINAAAHEHRRVLQLGLMHRYTAVGQAAKSIAASGQLGQVYHSKAQLCLRRNVPGLGGWFTTKAKAGGGALIDLGVHIIDLALYVLGHPQPIEVSGKVYHNFGKRMKDYVYEGMWAGPPNYEGVCDVDDAAHALLRFADGSTLELNVTWAGNFPDGSLPESLMGFFGDQAGMTFQLFGDHVRLAKEEHLRNVDTKVKLPTCDAMEQQMRDFLRARETREVRGATGPQARAVQAIIDAIYESSELNRAVAPRMNR